MTPHHVDSKQHKLSESDILMVTAHDMKHSALAFYKKHGSPKGISPERVYTHFLAQLWASPKCLRVREGNTLFRLTPSSKTAGVVYMYNADTLSQTGHNMALCIQAARKMGYKTLSIPTDHKAPGNARVLLAARRAATEAEAKFTQTGSLCRVEL
jgi:hypothetical protein